MSLEERHDTPLARRPLFFRALIIFGVALLLRVAISYYSIAAPGTGEYLFRDAANFYVTALNLANGHGYVVHAGEEPNYFREPANSYFYAGVIAVHKMLTGGPVREPVWSENRWPQDESNQHAIRLIRLAQGVLQALALVFFFLLLRHWFREGFAFAVALLVAVYPPLAFYSEQLMRENLLLGALMALAWLLSSHMRKPGYGKLALMGILWGIAALSLQVYVALGLVLFVFVAVYSRPLLRAVQRCAVVGAFFVLTVLPWLHTVYAYYPDVRIARSMGCALTFDWMQFNASLRYAWSHPEKWSGKGLAPPESLAAKDRFSFTARECFDNSFNGTFRRTAALVSARYGRPSRKEVAFEYAGQLAQLFALPGYQFEDWSSSRSVVEHDHGNMVFTMFVSFLIGAGSLIGLWVCCRRAIGVVPLYLFHLAFFWVLMSSTRRATPVLPLIVLFGIAGLWKVAQLAFPGGRVSIFREG